MDAFYNIFYMIQGAWDFMTKLIWDAFGNCFQIIIDIKRRISRHLTNLYILIVFIFKLLSPSIYTFGLACNIIALFLNTAFGTIDFFVNMHVNAIAFFMDITSFIFLTVINLLTSLYYLLSMIYTDDISSSTTQTISELSADNDTEAREIEYCQDSQNLQAILSEERKVLRPSEPASTDQPPSIASHLLSIHETSQVSFSETKPSQNVQKSPQKDNTVHNLDPASEGVPPSHDLSPESVSPSHDLAPEGAQSSADFALEDTKPSDLAPEGAPQPDLAPGRAQSFDDLTLKDAPSLDVLESVLPTDDPAPESVLPADAPAPESVLPANNRENVGGNIKLAYSEGRSASFGDGNVAHSDLTPGERFSQTPLALEEISTAYNEQIILDDKLNTEKIAIIDIPGNDETGEDAILVDKSKSRGSVDVEPQDYEEDLEQSNRPDAETSGKADHGDDKILGSASALTPPIGSTEDHEYRQIAFISPQTEQTSEVIAADFLKDDVFIDSNGKGKLSDNSLVEQPVDTVQVSEHSHEICVEERTSPLPPSLEVAHEQHSPEL